MDLVSHSFLFVKLNQTINHNKYWDSNDKPSLCLRSLWTFPDLEIEIPLTSPSLLTNSLEKAGSHPSPLLKCTQGEDCWKGCCTSLLKKTNESQFLLLQSIWKQSNRICRLWLIQLKTFLDQLDLKRLNASLWRQISSLCEIRRDFRLRKGYLPLTESI